MEVDESKLVDPAVLGAQTSRLRSATRAAAPKIVYTLDLADVQRWAKLVHHFPRSTLFGEHRPAFWRTIEPGSTVLAVVREGHRLYTRVDAQAGRRVYTVVEHDFARPQRWGHSGYLFLTYRGTGDGGAYRLIADFDRRHRRSVEFRLVDDQPGAQLRAFAIGPLRSDGPGVDWDHVSDIRFATEDLHVSTAGYGLLFSAGAVGSILGSVFATRIIRGVGSGRALISAVVISASWRFSVLFNSVIITESAFSCASSVSASLR